MRFNMQYAKLVSMPLAIHFKLNQKSSPITEQEKHDMSLIPYSYVVGSFMYLIVCTQSNIAHTVGIVSIFHSNLEITHQGVVKWIFRYLRGTSKICLSFGCFHNVFIIWKVLAITRGIHRSNMAGDLGGRKFTSSYMFTFTRDIISWQSKLQKYVAMSSIETELIAIIEATKQMLQLKIFLSECELNHKEYLVFCDNQSDLDLSKNTIYHVRTKHIDVRYHWLCIVIEDQELQQKKIYIDDNITYMLEK